MARIGWQAVRRACRGWGTLLDAAWWHVLTLQAPLVCGAHRDATRPPPPPPQFVNFKLYHSLGLRYPPALDGKLEAAAAGLEALMHDLAAAPSSAAGEPAAAGGGEADGGEERQVNPEAQQRIGSLADKVRAWGGAGLGKESNVLPGWLHAACVQGWPAAASAGWPTRRKTAAVALLPWCLLLHAPRKCLRCTLAGHPFIPCAPPPCRRPPPPPPPLPGA